MEDSCILMQILLRKHSIHSMPLFRCALLAVQPLSGFAHESDHTATQVCESCTCHAAEQNEFLFAPRYIGNFQADTRKDLFEKGEARYLPGCIQRDTVYCAYTSHIDTLSAVQYIVRPNY